jgi:V/A-type H+-transporting ATPase subunit I
VRLGKVGSAVVELAPPLELEPPTLFQPRSVAQPFRFLVQSYGTAGYREADPTRFTAGTFVVMFGMMFGDVGHGLVLALFGVWLRQRCRGRFAAFQRLWLIPFLAGLFAAGFGFLYGEAFGPTGLVPTLWLNPLDAPVTLLAGGLALGAVLLAVTYLIGFVNRRRQRNRRERSHPRRGLLKTGFELVNGAMRLATQATPRDRTALDTGARSRPPQARAHSRAK